MLQPKTNMAQFNAKPELKKIRESICTQEEMEKLLEIQMGRPFPRTTYTHKENGKQPITPEEAIAISRILKVPVNELFEQRKTEREKNATT